jgi:phosphoribosylaminoimidazole carboxylase PurE protein
MEINMLYRYHGEEISYSVEYSAYKVYAYLAGITAKKYYESADACIEAYRIGSEAIREIFGEQRIPIIGPGVYHLSYGHLVCLGGEFSMPEDSEPNVHPFASSVDEAIDILKAHKGMDFSKEAIVRHYVEYSRRLQEAFPELHLPISFPGVQGPVTSAELMRGQDFFMDIYDEPEKTAEFARTAASRDIRVIIAGAGLAAALPGVIAAHTTLPVIGVPIAGGPLNGVDALYAIVQMPKGIPVATVGISNARNAGLLAVQILALSDRDLAVKVAEYREKMKA